MFQGFVDALSTGLNVKGRIVHPNLPWRDAAPVNPANVVILLDGQGGHGNCATQNDGSFEITISECPPTGVVQIRVEDAENHITFPPLPFTGLPADLSHPSAGLRADVNFKTLVVPWPSSDVWGFLAAGLPVHVTMTGANNGPIEAGVNANLGGNIAADVNADLSGNVAADVNADLSGEVKADVNANAAATLAGDDQHPLRLDLSLRQMPKGKLILNGFDIGFYLFSWRIFSIKMKGEAKLDD